jgi:hypothetical protein
MGSLNPIRRLVEGRGPEQDRQMNPFAAIDDHLARRTTADGWELSTEWADAPARYFHIHGDRPWDCFQVNIVAPSTDRMTVTARSIDTNDGIEFEAIFSGAVGDFPRLLAAAVKTIEVWKGRAAWTR